MDDERRPIAVGRAATGARWGDGGEIRGVGQQEASGDDSDTVEQLQGEGEAVVQHRNTISLENKQQFYNTFCDNLMGGCITTVAVQAAHGATIARTLLRTRAGVRRGSCSSGWWPRWPRA
jgi:hypothetical protein